MTDVRFRDYKNYPLHLLSASNFRDENDDLPDGAFFAIAEEQGLLGGLDELAEFETKTIKDQIIGDILDEAG